MSQPSKKSVDAATKLIFDHLTSVEPNTKAIPCPIHNAQHPATLYCFPHEFAGIWECPVSGESDSCEHDELETEEIEVDTMRNGEHNTYLRSVYICMDCGTQVDGDPQTDGDEEDA